jgi:hypothetical protein
LIEKQALQLSIFIFHQRFMTEQPIQSSTPVGGSRVTLRLCRRKTSKVR